MCIIPIADATSYDLSIYYTMISNWILWDALQIVVHLKIQFSRCRQVVDDRLMLHKAIKRKHKGI